MKCYRAEWENTLKVRKRNNEKKGRGKFKYENMRLKALKKKFIVSFNSALKLNIQIKFEECEKNDEDNRSVKALNLFSSLE
jgi:hypothetical protein